MMTFVSITDLLVCEAANRILALRKLTAATGVKTYKSQSAILESLEPQVLAAVALILVEKGNENEQPIRN